jgi:hypothetical protein
VNIYLVGIPVDQQPILIFSPCRSGGVDAISGSRQGLHDTSQRPTQDIFANHCESGTFLLHAVMVWILGFPQGLCVTGFIPS